jgi:N-acetylneuraminic acid mutarotase
MGYTSTLLGNGKVLVAGGDSYSQQSDLTNTAELYDPATGEWSFTGNLNVRRAYHTATLLSNGKVLFAGGSAADSAAELYDPATGKWSLTGKLNESTIFSDATLLQDGKVLVAGGCESEDCFSTRGRAEIYDPNTETWSLTGSLNTGRSSFTLTTLPNGNVLLLGGWDPLPNPYLFFDTVELYNPATGRWSYTGSPRNNRFGHPVTLLPSGQVLVVGGGYPGVELYNPATGKWNTTASPNTDLGARTATLLSDGNVLVVGRQSAELYHPEVLAPTAPRIILASVSGKKLFIIGDNFHDGAVILLNGEEQKSKNDGTYLIGKKAGKKIKAGDLLQVRNPDGTLSAAFIFTGS